MKTIFLLFFLVTNARAVEPIFSISNSSKEVGEVEMISIAEEVSTGKNIPPTIIAGKAIETTSRLMLESCNPSGTPVFEIQTKWNSFRSTWLNSRMCKILDAKPFGENRVYCIYFLNGDLRASILEREEERWTEKRSSVLVVEFTSKPWVEDAKIMNVDVGVTEIATNWQSHRRTKRGIIKTVRCPPRFGKKGSEKRGQEKRGQGANLDSFILFSSFPACHGACVLNFPVPTTT